MSEIVGKGILYTVESGDTKLIVDSFGAKILGIIHKGENILFYDKDDIGHSGIPLCFPNFGPLKDGKLLAEGKEYSMGQHGFFRDSEFTIEEDFSYLFCTLKESEESLQKWPYPFEARFEYSVYDGGIGIDVNITNTGDKPFKLAPGLHPYFAVKNPKKIFFTTKAEKGNDNSQGYKEVGLKESGVFTVVDIDALGTQKVQVCDSPDMHLIHHGTQRTLISGEGQPTIEMIADPEVFDRMTIWRKSSDVNYICVEPASRQNAINEDGIEVLPGDKFFTRLNIDIVD